MRCLLFGSGGQLGSRIRTFSPPGFEIIPIDRDEVDLTDLSAIGRVILNQKPDVVINAAAYTAVDAAESDEHSAHQVNAVAPGVMAEVAHQSGALIVHYSTDYVFDGCASVPYTEDMETRPLGVYGRTKLAGERAVATANPRHLIFRTSWVYDASGKNFLTTMLRLSSDRNELSVVNDQFGSPTTTQALTDASFKILGNLSSPQEAPAGVYHMTCGGQTSWCQFAHKIFNETGTTVAVHGIPTEQYPTPAQRPKYSVLNNSRLESVFGVHLPTWEVALAQCLKEARFATY